MKHSILNWILGASLVIAAPAAMADNNWKKNKHANKHNKHFVDKSHKHNNYCAHKPRHQSSQYNNHNYTWSNSRHNSMRRAIQHIHKRQNNQARRINKGINKGQLVRREVITLRKEQRRISERLRHFQYDGRLNRHERNKINQMLNVASNHIRNKRHNRLTQRSQHNNNQYGYNQHNHNQHRSTEDILYDFVLNW